VHSAALPPLLNFSIMSCNAYNCYCTLASPVHYRALLPSPYGSVRFAYRSKLFQTILSAYSATSSKLFNHVLQ